MTAWDPTRWFRNGRLRSFIYNDRMVMDTFKKFGGIGLCLFALSGIACDNRVIEPKSVKPETKALFDQAQDIERSGNVRAAVPIYERAARSGSGQSAYALMDIYGRGAPGVPRNYQKSLGWYEEGRKLGMPSLTANCVR